MPLIKDNAFVENTYARVADEETLPEGAVVISLKRFQAERETLLARNTQLGIRLTADQSPEALAADIQHFALIELEFPKFKDGRAYSWARLLRQRLGFNGELRAVGEVLRDQWLFMSRCGIDAFEVRPGTRIENFRAAMIEQTVFYQPASDRVRSVLDLRHHRPARNVRAAAE
jgi:uncharacterized protein (DUF934 family)